MQVAIKLNDAWITIEENLPFREHVENARRLGATVIRTIDGQIEQFLNEKETER